MHLIHRYPAGPAAERTPPTVRCWLFGAILALSVAGCNTPRGAPVSVAEVGELRPGLVKGYLNPKLLPDSLALLPAPPATGSAAQAADDASYRALTLLQATPRAALAVRDADLYSPKATASFSCALGVSISAQETPNLHMLLRRTLTDAGLATYKAKDKYQRSRPFAVFNEPSCTPAEEDKLVKDGSYPSGHSALGWAWALVLTDIAPERADALLQRGRSFGQSRAICGVHWQSDVEAGRLVGAATVARLHSDTVFLVQRDAARVEVAQARRQAKTPSPTDCADEAAAQNASMLQAP